MARMTIEAKAPPKLRISVGVSSYSAMLKASRDSPSAGDDAACSETALLTEPLRRDRHEERQREGVRNAEEEALQEEERGEGGDGDCRADEEDDGECRADRNHPLEATAREQVR